MGPKRARVDSQSPSGARRPGNVVAYEFLGKGFSRVDVNTNGSEPTDTLAGQLLGVKLKPAKLRRARGITGSPTRAGMGDDPAAARSCFAAAHAHLRDPVGPQIHFASESFMDEVAAATGADPIDSACVTSRTRGTSP